VDGPHVGDRNALRWGQDGAALGPNVEAGAVRKIIGAASETREPGEGGLHCGSNACLVHSAVQDPFQDVVTHRTLCCKGNSKHAVAGACAAESGPTLALHSWDSQGLHGARRRCQSLPV
jgi:hypothetical protein